MEAFLELISQASGVKIRLKKFHGMNGIKYLKAEILHFFTRIKQAMVKKVASLN